MKLNMFFITVIIIIFGLNFSKTVFAKGYKLYACNYFVSYNLAKDKCTGSNSFYKIYFENKNANFKSRDECMQEMDKTINSNLMSQMFPEGDGTDASSWILDCDNLWKF